MKLLNCLVHLDEPPACVERDVEVSSIKDRQGMMAYHGAKHVVEYVGKGGSNGPLVFKEVKPTEDQMWLL